MNEDQRLEPTLSKQIRLIQGYSSQENEPCLVRSTLDFSSVDAALYSVVHPLPPATEPLENMDTENVGSPHAKSGSDS